MSAYEPNSRHLREVLIFCFNMKKSVAEAHRMLSNTCGETSIGKRTCPESGFNALRTVILTSKTIMTFGGTSSADEAHFWLNGYVNKQNWPIWSEANPQVYVETPLHPEKLTVWCSLCAGGILLQKR
ncbi:mariner Mos1 transposase [Trichonephila clavipes]|nr:mariner Mos1 transposase [Trichonephila clavipes]